MKTKCPYCNQKYEIEDEWNGKTVKCQSCDRDFIVEQVQPIMNTVQTYDQPKIVQTNVKQGAVIGAALCLALAIGIQSISNFLFLLYLLLYLVSFILSIVAMAQKRIFWGMIILLTTIISPWIVIGVTYEKDAEIIKKAINKGSIQTTNNKSSIKKIDNPSMVKPILKTEYSVKGNDKNQTTPIKEDDDEPNQVKDNDNNQAMQVKENNNKPTSLKGKTDGAKKSLSVISNFNGAYFDTVFQPDADPVSFTDGTIAYRYQPKSIFRNFNFTLVELTPITKKIHTIRISTKTGNSAKAQKEFDLISDILQKKYNLNEIKNRFSIYQDRKIFEFTNGKFLLIYDDNPFSEGEVSIICVDDRLKNLAEKEQKELEIRKTDIGAL